MSPDKFAATMTSNRVGASTSSAAGADDDLAVIAKLDTETRNGSEPDMCN